MSDENEVDEFAVDPALQKLIDELNAKLVSGGGGGKRSNIVFLGEGKHVVKMVIPQERALNSYFEPYDNVYNGKTSVNYLINAVIVISKNAKGEDTDFADRTKVRHIRLPAMAVRMINAQIANWPIFDDDGPVIEITISGKGVDTRYAITVSNKRFPKKDVAKLEWPEMNIHEAARDAEEFAKSKNSKATDTLPFVDNSKKDSIEWE